MRDDTTLALRPDLFGQLAATDPFQGRARRLYERGQVLAVNGNQADLRVGYDARNNPLDLKEVPIVSGYIPRVGDWVAIQYEAGHSGAPWVTGPSMAADDSEDPPGIGVFSVSSEEPADPQKSTVYFDEPASTWRGWNGAAWVDLGGGGGGLHNSLPDLQGGAAGEYYHLTAAQWNALVGNMPFGAGAVLFADGSNHIAGDAGSFFWDAQNKRLGIGFGAPAHDIHAEIDIAAGVDGSVTGAYYAYSENAGEFSTLQWHSFTFRRPSANYIQVYPASGLAGYIDYRLKDTGDVLHTPLRVTSGPQVLFATGSAAKPSAGFISYPTMGMYAHSSTVLGFATGGAMRASLNATGLAVSGPGKGAFEAAYPLDVRGDWDGIASFAMFNENAGASAAARGYYRTDGGGDAYVLMRVPTAVYWSYGIDNDQADRFAWAVDTTLGASDRMRLERTGVWWLKPITPSFNDQGQAAMNSSHSVFCWYFAGGSAVQLGASLLDDALTTNQTEYDVGGALPEQAISTHTVADDLSKAGNSVKVVARGTARIDPKGPGQGGADLHVKFRIEGTDIFDLNLGIGEAQAAKWIWFEFTFDATMRSTTSWMISNVKARYYNGWQQAGNPWPATVTLTQLDYVRDTPFTVSGNITTEVRGAISNGSPGASYVSVHEHKAGLEQL